MNQKDRQNTNRTIYAYVVVRKGGSIFVETTSLVKW